MPIWIHTVIIVRHLVIFQLLPYLLTLVLREMAKRALTRSPRAPRLGFELLGTFLFPVGAHLFDVRDIVGWTKGAKSAADEARCRPARQIAASVAGLLVCLAMALLWSAVLVLVTNTMNAESSNYGTVISIIREAIEGNVTLFLVNLLPLPWFDGGGIAAAMLKPSAREKFYALRGWAFFVMLGLLFTGFLGLLANHPQLYLTTFIANLWSKG